MTDSHEETETYKHQPTGYVREGDLDGVPVWTLFDDEGRALLITDNRSSVFFYAHGADMKVVTRH